MARDDAASAYASGVPSHERQFYALTRAIGRFGMRIFTPTIMGTPHWHGHIELNFLTGASMTYRVDEAEIEIGPGRLVLFWAGIPHQLTGITPVGSGPAKLANIYLPFDTFLFMPHIAQLQVALLGGALVSLPDTLCDLDQIECWYRDYRSNDFERTEVMKMEMNAMMRRALLSDLDYLRPPIADPGDERTLSSAHIRHVVAMVRYIMENLPQPMSNADVAAVTGLHQNYALALFTRTMRLPMKRFIIRMRLLRARALLMESSAAITTVAEQSGFPSISQFYDHFKAAYGMSPHAMRSRYTQMELR
ncbi:MAG: helix-turn-helix domain-containing protein [Rhodobacterales bacterium]|nr:helix-turn-helix domain-containing protein [Rhodobacterales bacterium]